MKSRSLASLVVGSLIILTASGCAAITPQATTIQYSASDGVNVPDVEGAPLQVRNALVVTDDGERGNLVAAVVNDTGSGETLTLEWAEDNQETLRVPAGTTMSLGSDNDETAEEPLLLEGIDAAAGDTMPIFFQSGDAQGVVVEVPVFDGEVSYLSELVPDEAVSDGTAPAPADTP